MKQSKRRAALGLLLGVAGMGASLGVAAPAQAGTTWMCSTGPVPGGYVVTQAYANSPACPGYFYYQITNEFRPGMVMCSVTQPPPGWIVSQSFWNAPPCNPYYSTWVINPL